MTSVFRVPGFSAIAGGIILIILQPNTAGITGVKASCPQCEFKPVKTAGSNRNAWQIHSGIGARLVPDFPIYNAIIKYDFAFSSKNKAPSL